MAKNEVRFDGVLDLTARQRINNNFRDVAVSTATLTATANTTLANVAGLVTGTLDPGTYTFRINLGVGAGASGGLKVALKQEVPSMLTSIDYNTRAFSAAGVVATRGTTASDAASIIASTTAVVGAEIVGTVVVAKAGTLQVQAAQNASDAAATTVIVGSFLEFIRVGN
jgi:hypothetical protein